MNDFSFDLLRRHPDIEAPELVAVDATDRLLLDEAGDALAAAAPGSVVVVGDRYGALTLGAVALHGVEGIRVQQDLLTGERALQENAERAGLTDTYTAVPLGAEAFTGARLVLLQLPRSLDELDEVARLIAASAAPDVVVLAGGRVKHMTHAMNDVLGRSFGTVEARLARQKSRVLVATQPRPAEETAQPDWPASEHHADLDLTLCAHGGVFAGTRIDLGTRLLLDRLDAMLPSAQVAVDLACGTGAVAALLARRRPDLTVIATDDSAAAVASARATAAANGLADRVVVRRDDALSSRAAGSVDLVVLHPPFHAGATVHSGIALKLFADAGRVLRPGGELWTVWNSHLQYRPALERAVGRTRQVTRTSKFTVTASAAA